jgi:hypothetical protein
MCFLWGTDWTFVSFSLEVSKFSGTPWTSDAGFWIFYWRLSVNAKIKTPHPLFTLVHRTCCMTWTNSSFTNFQTSEHCSGTQWLPCLKLTYRAVGLVCPLPHFVTLSLSLSFRVLRIFVQQEQRDEKPFRQTWHLKWLVTHANFCTLNTSLWHCSLTFFITNWWHRRALTLGSVGWNARLLARSQFASGRSRDRPSGSRFSVVFLGPRVGALIPHPASCFSCRCAPSPAAVMYPWGF